MASRRPAVGRLARGGPAAAGAALLHRAALLPFSEIAKSDDSNLSTVIDSLIKRNVSAMMLADIGTLPHDIKERVEQWVKKGGILVRFAGPRLEKGGDDLLPVPLRLGGGRWAAPVLGKRRNRSHPSSDDSLFAGLMAPAEVLVNKQVLADPAGAWTRGESVGAPEDGTPARHVRQARGRPAHLLPRHRQLRLVEPAALGPVRGDAAPAIASLGGTGGAGETLSATARALHRMHRQPPRCWRPCRSSTASVSSRTRRPRRRPSPRPRSSMRGRAPRTRPATMGPPGARVRSI
jgi:hypothetical protein